MYLSFEPHSVFCSYKDRADQHKCDTPICHHCKWPQQQGNIWMSHGLTSIVHCDAAVWGWSISCYLWTLFWVLLIGQLWEGEKPLPVLFEAAMLLFIWNRCFLYKEASDCLCSIKWLSQHPGLLQRIQKRLSITRIIRGEEWKMGPHQKKFFKHIWTL